MAVTHLFESLVPDGNDETQVRSSDWNAAHVLSNALKAIDGLTPAASKIAYFSGADSAALTDITATGISLLGVADAAAGRTTLELGTVATQAANNVSLTGGSISGMTSISGSTLASTVATGTAPLTITSSTLVTNLNTDAVDGFHASQTPGANQIPVLNSAGRLVLGGSDDGGSALQVSGALRVSNNITTGAHFVGSAATLMIRRDTADGADDGAVYVCSGGWPQPTRGGFVELRGNESATNPGDVRLVSGGSGDTSGGNVSMLTGGGFERFKVLPSGRILVGSTLPTDNGVDALQVNGTIKATGYKTATYNFIEGYINASTSDGSDNSYLVINGGGSNADVSRGSFIGIYGNEVATNGGCIFLTAGNVATGNINFRTGALATRMQINNAGRILAGQTLPTDDGVSTIQVNGTLKASGINTHLLGAYTSDGADTATVYLRGGGDMSASRGAFISLTGNDAANISGDVRLYAGEDPGKIAFITGNPSTLRMLILTNGRILAGPTLPTDDGVSTLQLNGTIASKGVKLDGTASSNVNTLDYYKEGTFTPVIYGETTAGSGTYTTQTGKYTRIGNIVHYNIALIWTAHTGTGNMRISGFPYNASVSCPCSDIYYDAFTVGSGKECNAVLSSGGSSLGMKSLDPSGGTVAAIAIDTAGTLIIQGTYFV